MARAHRFSVHTNMFLPGSYKSTVQKIHFKIRTIPHFQIQQLSLLQLIQQTRASATGCCQTLPDSFLFAVCACPISGACRCGDMLSDLPSLITCHRTGFQSSHTLAPRISSCHPLHRTVALSADDIRTGIAACSGCRLVQHACSERLTV